MMERRVLDKLEARRMVFVGTCWTCGLVSYLENDDEDEEEKEKTTYHPTTSISIPTNHPHHRKNSIQHNNPHRSPHQSLQSTHIEMRIPNREEIYVGSL